VIESARWIDDTGRGSRSARILRNPAGRGGDLSSFSPGARGTATCRKFAPGRRNLRGRRPGPPTSATFRINEARNAWTLTTFRWELAGFRQPSTSATARGSRRPGPAAAWCRWNQRPRPSLRWFRSRTSGQVRRRAHARPGARCSPPQSQVPGCSCSPGDHRRLFFRRPRLPGRRPAPPGPWTGKLTPPFSGHFVFPPLFFSLPALTGPAMSRSPSRELLGHAWDTGTTARYKYPRPGKPHVEGRLCPPRAAARRRSMKRDWPGEVEPSRGGDGAPANRGIGKAPGELQRAPARPGAGDGDQRQGRLVRALWFPARAEQPSCSPSWTSSSCAVLGFAMMGGGSAELLLARTRERWPCRRPRPRLAGEPGPPPCLCNAPVTPRARGAVSLPPRVELRRNCGPAPRSPCRAYRRGPGLNCKTPANCSALGASYPNYHP